MAQRTIESIIRQKLAELPPSEHAKYSPSKLDRIIECPGSVLASEGLEEKPSAYADEGTLLHAITAHVLTKPSQHYVWENKEYQVLVNHAIGEVYVIERAAELNMALDVRVKMHGTPVEGTLDVCLYDDDTIHVIDFKFGGGIEVDAQDNPQLLAYLAGAIQKFVFKPNHMYIHIIQPRLNAHKVQEVTIEQLQEFYKRVNKAIYLIESNQAPIKAGAHCRWCLVGGACSTRIEQARSKAVTALTIAADLPSAAHDVDLDYLAKILATRTAVEAGFKAIELYLFKQLLAGVEVPGFKLTSGRASRKWKEDVDPCDLGEALGLDVTDVMDTKMKTPAQVEKLLNAKGKAKLSQFYQTFEGPVTIAPSSSAKPAINALASLKALADNQA